MTIETIHEEFERLGEAAVEELFVRRGRDELKRIYALRWLEATAGARLAAEAARKRAAEEKKINVRRALRIAATTLMLVFGTASIALILLRTAVFH